MKKISVALAVFFLVLPVAAQDQPPPHVPVVHRPSSYGVSAMVTQAVHQFGEDKKIYGRDLEVLGHIRQAVADLSDQMQKAVAVEKAWDELQKAKLIGPDFRVMQGLGRAIDAVESARKGPEMADLSRLQFIIGSEAVRPARNVVAENARRIQEETVEWLRIQEAIAAHLMDVTEFNRENLKQAQ